MSLTKHSTGSSPFLNYPANSDCKLRIRQHSSAEMAKPQYHNADIALSELLKWWFSDETTEHTNSDLGFFKTVIEINIASGES